MQAAVPPYVRSYPRDKATLTAKDAIAVESFRIPLGEDSELDSVVAHKPSERGEPYIPSCVWTMAFIEF